MSKLIDILSSFRRWVIGGLFCLVVLSIALSAGSVTIFSILFFILSFFIPKNKVPIKFLSSLKALLDSGYSLTESIQLLGQYHPRYRKRLPWVASALKNGSSFADACKRHLRRFPGILIKVLREGEKTSDLPGFINTYLDYYNIELTFKEIKKRAFVYPAIVFAICLFFGVIISIFVYPSFSNMFSSFNKELPLMTQITMKVTPGFKYIIYLILLVFIVHLVKKWIAKRGLIQVWQKPLDALLLMLFSKRVLERGGSLSEALVSATLISGDKRYIRAADALIIKVNNGISWLEALKESTGLPPDLVTAIASGNVANEMPKTFDQLIVALRDLYSFQMKRSTRRLELAAILFNIILWGFVIISFYLPIFKMAELV